MTSFAEFESTFLNALPKERSYLQGLQGKLEAQLSAWIEHIFRDYLGYSWEEILHPEGMPLGSKGSKQLYRDLQINILDNGFIFFECKRTGRLTGSNGQEELDDAIRQLKNYIRAQLDPMAVKPKITLGLVTDGNRWHLMGLKNDFYPIADWTFLTDDPRLIARHLWLLAKPALAQPTSAFVEFLARRTLADFLQSESKWITKKVNEKLPDGAVSEELIGKWLRDAFSDQAGLQQLISLDATPAPGAVPTEPETTDTDTEDDESGDSSTGQDSDRHRLRLKFWQTLLSRPKAKGTRHADITPGKYSRLGAGSGVRGVPFTYAIGQRDAKVELWIDRGPDEGKEANKRILDRLQERKGEIETAFGSALSWQPLEGKRACRISYTIKAGGYRSDESQWPTIQDAMIDAMIRLEKALAPHLEKLKMELAT
jgi:hypothetical protein